MNRSGGGKALGNVDGGGRLAQHPELAASGAAWVIPFLAICCNVLDRSQITLGTVQRDHQPPIAGDPGAVGGNTFSGKIRMIGTRRTACCPDGIHRGGGNRLASLLLGLPCRLGLGHSPAMRHLLGNGKFAPHLGLPGLLDARPPAAEATCRDAIAKCHIPAWLAVAW